MGRFRSVLRTTHWRGALLTKTPYDLVRNFALRRLGHSPACRCKLLPTIKKYIIMKKYIVLAALVLATSVGVGYAANALHRAEDHSKCETGYKCNLCNGTGWNGQFKCHMCKGTGTAGSY